MLSQDCTYQGSAAFSERNNSRQPATTFSIQCFSPDSKPVTHARDAARIFLKAAPILMNQPPPNEVCPRACCSSRLPKGRVRRPGRPSCLETDSRTYTGDSTPFTTTVLHVCLRAKKRSFMSYRDKVCAKPYRGPADQGSRFLDTEGDMLTTVMFRRVHHPVDGEEESMHAPSNVKL